jgi:ornithine cyclodeaminase/alanine dehydrogenase-like protein (mu-crystallin family)
VIGAGVNGRAAARTFVTRGRPVRVWDVNRGRAEQVARELGCGVAESLDDALADDIVVTVTPGHEVLFADGSLRPGQHLSLMGADGPGKAEVAGSELARAHLFCDDWEQASHGGELTAAVTAGVVQRTDVTEFGAVLIGEADGRRSAGDITLFDSTGLAIQDLAIAKVAYARRDELDLQTIEL